MEHFEDSFYSHEKQHFFSIKMEKQAFLELCSLLSDLINDRYKIKVNEQGCEQIIEKIKEKENFEIKITEK